MVGLLLLFVKWYSRFVFTCSMRILVEDGEEGDIKSRGREEEGRGNGEEERERGRERVRGGGE